MYKTLSYDIIRFLLTQHTFVIAIHTFAFFAVLAMITFVFISDAYSIVGASLITATICIFAIVVGTAAIMTSVGSCTEFFFATSWNTFVFKVTIVTYRLHTKLAILTHNTFILRTAKTTFWTIIILLTWCTYISRDNIFLNVLALYERFTVFVFMIHALINMVYRIKHLFTKKLYLLIILMIIRFHEFLINTFIIDNYMELITICRYLNTNTKKYY